MSDRGTIELEGEVIETLPNATFRVRVGEDHEVLCTLAGRMRYRVSVARGDRVQLEVSPYDLDRGRIIGRVS